MNQPDAVRSGDEVIRELLRLDQQVKEARKVLMVDGEVRPKLLAELNAGLEGLGLKCVAVGEDAPARDSAPACACALKAPCRSFSDIELAPLASVAQVAPLTQVASVASVASVVPDPVPVIAYEPQSPAPVPAPEKLDMSKPINWVRGDIFSENPRFTLAHKRREWALKVIDVADHEGLKGIDIEIQAVGTEDSELMNIQQFMARYVFVRRAESTAE